MYFQEFTPVGPKLDVLIVSGARPELLSRTLKSFQENLFVNFELGRCYVNIDPFEGGADEITECRKLIGDYFSNPVVRSPPERDFTKAVKWLWSKPENPYCLHLEDDWILHSAVKPKDVFPHFHELVRQVSFLTSGKKWKIRSPYHSKVLKRKFLGVTFDRVAIEDEPVFTTSPSFLQRDFVRKAARLMDVNYDPEKQLYREMVPALRAYTRQYRNYFIGDRKNFIVEDIGREYRINRGLKKYIVDGQSVWQEN